MFDFLRVAGLATLALGAAGASGELPAVAKTAFSVQAVTTDPLPAAPVTLPLPEDVRAQAEVEAVTPALVPAIEEPRAESLAALVRRHAGGETADREQNCLATAIYFESKGEPLDGQLAVANVILNRAQSGRFASTICGVVLQRGQFSFVRGGALPVISRDNGNWRTAVAIAKIAQDDLWDSSTENALYFHARRVAPGWRMARVGTIGNHVFYR
ncbi:cell wall hydrolase [Sphingomonas sp. SUN039]|uniref:cell wall hydrolase n=1 Tax=Sphingomonas sp. SUN039 TaxID=2937787 RepID=UPI002164E14B|nr:cell wall hydrolase [Sphingomonas sp. SUN039]UVO55227.1 cell wall hydrolase [Sphingomonas sp. SUN039]